MPGNIQQVYDYFTIEELACRHCGAYKFDPSFLALLNELRHRHGSPLIVTSGYRCPDHPIEINRATTGTHTTGKAIDLAVSHGDALSVIAIAHDLGVRRIGVQQKGDGRFIHLDVCTDRISPACWSY